MMMKCLMIQTGTKHHSSKDSKRLKHRQISANLVRLQVRVKTKMVRQMALQKPNEFPYPEFVDAKMDARQKDVLASKVVKDVRTHANAHWLNAEIAENATDSIQDPLQTTILSCPICLTTQQLEQCLY